MPDPLEFPGMSRAVVPLMGAGISVVGEFISRRLPRFAAVVGSLDLLAKPAAGLGGVDSIRLDRRTFEMIDFPAGKERTGDVPVLSLAVGREDEGAFPRPDENPHAAHGVAPVRDFVGRMYAEAGGS